MKKILCVDKSLINSKWAIEKVSFYCEDNILENFDQSALKWIDEKDIKANDNYKQIIIYGIVNNWSDETACHPRDGKENGLWSLGICDSVNTEDDMGSDFVATAGTALTRVFEEKFTDFDFGNSNFDFIGIINEESSDLGKTHIAFVYKAHSYETPTPEEELKGLVWVKKGQFTEYNLDSWSKLVLDHK